MKYIFTYGMDPAYPYQSGWTEVEAESYDQATSAFQAFHPNRPGSDFINCAEIYGEESFSKKKMAKNGNFGDRCLEYIRVTRQEKTMDEDLVSETTYFRRERVKKA